MEINKKSLHALTSLPDDELRKKINDAASACGVRGDKAAKYMGDMSAIKKKLNSLSDSQIRALLDAVGEENVRKIKESLDNGSKR